MLSVSLNTFPFYSCLPSLRLVPTTQNVGVLSIISPAFKCRHVAADVWDWGGGGGGGGA